MSFAMVKVGYTEGKGSDASRENWSGTGPRPLNWLALYPTDDQMAEQEVFDGPDGAPWASLGPMVPSARLAAGDAPLPVILTSHGTGGTARGFGWFGRRLAAQGYVVLGVDHHGNTRAEPYRAEGFLCWWERARDLSVLLDHVATVPLFRGRLDMTRVYAAGFSLGGYTVLSLAGAITDMPDFVAWNAQRAPSPGPREFPDLADHIKPLFDRSRVFRESRQRHSLCYADPRIRAILACAPALPVRAFTSRSLASLDRPVTLVVGGADAEAPPHDCAGWLDERLPKSRLVHLGDLVGHAVFLCEGTTLGRRADPLAFVDPPGVDRRVIHDDVASLALALFRP